MLVSFFAAGRNIFRLRGEDGAILDPRLSATVGDFDPEEMMLIVNEALDRDPEDADLLIENTETGRTIARHNLKIIDTLFESTACLIGNKESLVDAQKSERIDTFTNKLRRAVT